jgi:glutathione synthase/RimK-type ligase-like ATP-grasp enzyme
MSDKMLILVNRKSSVNKKLARYLNKNYKNKYKVELHTFSETFFEIKTGKVKIKIKNFDIAKYKLVFIRSAGKYIRSIGGIIKYLDYKKVKFIDPAYREVGMSLDKASSALRLAIKGIPVPYTIFCYRESVLDNREKIIKALGFPIIAKAIFSQQNRDIYILKSQNDFNKLIKKSNKDFIFQKFINIEKEYRFLILGEKVCVLEQKNKRNYENLKVEYKDLTGPSVFLNLYCATQSANKIALKSAAILGLDIAGVDLAFEKETKKIYIIEVNKGPGIEADARTSPELKVFSDYLLSRIK